MAREKKSFGAAASEAASTPQVTTKSTGMLTNKIAAAGRSQNIVRPVTMRVNPEECRLWDRHNRNYALLNEENCGDLIQSFIAAGQQEVPAYVRRLESKGREKYEIIAGARRFWTVKYLRENNYPNFQYLIEVRSLTDEEAFRLSNTENLDRRDISDYERAIDYKDALGLYYHGKQSDMAERLRKSAAWINRYMTMAELPVQIANAYANWGDLKITHAPELLKLVTTKATATKILQLATELHAENVELAHSGRKPLSGADVFKRLKAVGQATRKAGARGPIQNYGTGKSVHLSLKSKNQRGLSLVVPLASGADPEDIIVAFRQCLNEHYKA